MATILWMHTLASRTATTSQGWLEMKKITATMKKRRDCDASRKNLKCVCVNGVRCVEMKLGLKREIHMKKPFKAHLITNI